MHPLRPTTFQDQAANKDQLARLCENESRSIVVPPVTVEIEKTLAAEVHAVKGAAKLSNEEKRGQRQQRHKTVYGRAKRTSGPPRRKETILTSKHQRSSPQSVGSFNLTWYSAKYRVDCPKIFEDFGTDNEEIYTLSMARMNSNVAYGHLEMGIIDAYLRSTEIDAKSQTITFH